MTKNEILAVAIDTVKGNVDTKYSKKQNSEELVNAFIELNGGSKKLDPKTFYRGNELFEIVQELIPVIIDEGINTEDNPLFDHVDYRNIADGDTAQFDIEGDANFVVASVANGIRDIRRQRIVGGATVTVNPEMKMVRVYEELARLLAGRIDFDKYVEGVAKAFKDYIADCAYTALNGIDGSTIGADYVVGGTPSEADIVALIERVEAATGKSAIIVGTKTALRKLSVAESGNLYHDDKYNLGYYGKYNGTPCYRMKQALAADGSTFILNDSKLWILASDDKFIKVVNEGDGMLIEKQPADNADLTQELEYAIAA